MPAIRTRWIGEEKDHVLYHANLQIGPLFRLYNKKFLHDHQLPRGPIAYRYHPEIFVHGHLLTQLIENFILELLSGKNEHENFIILKKRDFNKKTKAGLIIAKFKEYPFVVKIFMENPQSFIKFFSKGFEPCCFFMMSGTNRYLNGFTRIKNLLNLKLKVEQDPYWASRINFPRKWFWISNNTKWFELTGFNLGPYKEVTTHMPSVYAIIEDYIMIDRVFCLHNEEDRKSALALSNYLNHEIDPHINNYVFEQNTGLIVPIDTEHFPTMVGMYEPRKCTSYLQWYINLSCKMVYDTFGRSKRARKHAQYQDIWPLGHFINPELITVI